MSPRRGQHRMGGEVGRQQNIVFAWEAGISRLPKMAGACTRPIPHVHISGHQLAGYLLSNGCSFVTLLFLLNSQARGGMKSCDETLCDTPVLCYAPCRRLQVASRLGQQFLLAASESQGDIDHVTETLQQPLHPLTALPSAHNRALPIALHILTGMIVRFRMRAGVGNLRLMKLR